MLTFKMQNKWTNVAVPILQGLAGGTLLYVTVSEILPRERARWHKKSATIRRRFAALVRDSWLRRYLPFE